MEEKTLKIPVQVFNGKNYYLYPNEVYFSKSNRRLHRVVWSHYNGKIPKGFDVHHKDGNTHNNDISNLNCLNNKLHKKFTMKKRIKENKDGWFDKFQSAGQEAAKEWHKSPEGLEWHRQHAKDHNFGKFDLPDIECLQCSKVFKPKTKRTKFCSNNCKSTYRRNSGIDDIVVICVNCGDKFISNKYVNKLRCSTDCKPQNK